MIAHNLCCLHCLLAWPCSDARIGVCRGDRSRSGLPSSLQPTSTTMLLRTVAGTSVGACPKRFCKNTERYVCISMCIYIYICTYMRTYACTHTCVCVYMYLCKYTSSRDTYLLPGWCSRGHTRLYFRSSWRPTRTMRCSRPLRVRTSGQCHVGACSFGFEAHFKLSWLPYFVLLKQVERFIPSWLQNGVQSGRTATVSEF